MFPRKIKTLDATHRRYGIFFLCSSNLTRYHPVKYGVAIQCYALGPSSILRSCIQYYPLPISSIVRATYPVQVQSNSINYPSSIIRATPVPVLGAILCSANGGLGFG